jgi:hypothetical protein
MPSKKEYKPNDFKLKRGTIRACNFCEGSYEGILPLDKFPEDSQYITCWESISAYIITTHQNRNENYWKPKRVGNGNRDDCNLERMIELGLMSGNGNKGYKLTNKALSAIHKLYPAKK